MRVRIVWNAVAAGLIAMCGAGLAAAAPCYVIFDRNDAVIYRDGVPPFDLSDTGSRERAALRQRGHHLLVAEFENCFAVGYVSPTTGGTAASVDEIVLGLQPALGTSMGGRGSYVTSSPSGSGASAGAAPARAAPKAGY